MGYVVGGSFRVEDRGSLDVLLIVLGEILCVELRNVREEWMVVGDSKV